MTTTITDATDTTPSDGTPSAPPPDPWWRAPGIGGPRLSFSAAALVALASGGLLLLAFPPINLWFMAPPAVALFAIACHRRKFRGGLGIGFLAGLAFFLPLLSWTSTQLGPFPWIMLSLLQALYFGFLGAASALSSRFADRFRAWWPLAVGVLWVGQEALRDRTPFGGFPWGRLAFSQADSPLASFAWLGGAPLVTFAVAACGGLLALAAWRSWRGGVAPTAADGTNRPLATAADNDGAGLPSAVADGRATPARPRAADTGQRRVVTAAALVGAAVLIVLAGLVVPTWTTAPSGDKTTVALVQGNIPRTGGIDVFEHKFQVLKNHVKGTKKLAKDIKAKKVDKPELVVWAENSSDIDPFSDAEAARLISSAAKAVDVPILLGTLQRDGDGIRNVSVVWDPEKGPGFTYTKQHPVPFAEYIPMKPAVRAVAGLIDERMVEGIDRVNGFTPGDKPGVIPAAGLTVSGIICFEVAYDDLVRTSVTEGSQILAVQTNNASFNNAEATQQMAMVRLRSIEHGRPGLMVSTVGVSGFTDASGAVYDQTSFNTSAVIVRTFSLGTGETPATRLGEIPEFAACVAAVGVLAAAVVLRRRRTSDTSGPAVVKAGDT
ncbi:apolipoprotein N-acyltransferase [Stackebrandtia nassauensis]|uniref:Apolipoprotein N-acyltransferase n=1 Tax=Stackebrandtia nassauensis (strain DSM 44728 / CIP 108903 / NRRL B-16338 / NBRC 102104 / LLR-40K-21) TaxID=446470 RepID=D3PZR1_STANL|nr:apolipoprotein N-acyltransferase [Stackebrandtia nassauensis]ADD43598.1 apolipoprotein N-acyltransferase [Stackebrandtia nassauensis DSM 44728]